MKPVVHDKPLDRRAKLAFGVAVICVLFLTETTVAHRTVPHPASPLIWTLLGSVAVLALVLGAVWHRRARQASGPAAVPPDGR
jgi:hypothetical protein